MTINLTMATAAVLLSGLIPALVLIAMIVCKKWKFLSLAKGMLLYLAVSIGLSPLIYNAVYSSVSSFDPMAASLILAAVMSGFELILIYGIVRFILSKEKDQRVKKDMVIGYSFGYCISAAQVCFKNLVITDHIRIQDYSYLDQVLNLSLEQKEAYIQAYSQNIGLGFLAVALEAVMLILIYGIVFKKIDLALESSGKKEFLKAGAFLFPAIAIIYLGSFLPETILFAAVLLQMAIIVLYIKKEKEPYIKTGKLVEYI